MKIILKDNNVPKWEPAPWFAWYPVPIWREFDGKDLIREWRWLETVFRRWEYMSAGASWERQGGRWSYMTREGKDEYDRRLEHLREKEKDVWSVPE